MIPDAITLPEIDSFGGLNDAERTSALAKIGELQVDLQRARDLARVSPAPPGLAAKIRDMEKQLRKLCGLLE